MRTRGRGSSRLAVRSIWPPRVKGTVPLASTATPSPVRWSSVRWAAARVTWARASRARASGTGAGRPAGRPAAVRWTSTVPRGVVRPVPFAARRPLTDRGSHLRSTKAEARRRRGRCERVAARRQGGRRLARPRRPLAESRPPPAARSRRSTVTTPPSRVPARARDWRARPATWRPVPLTAPRMSGAARVPPRVAFTARRPEGSRRRTTAFGTKAWRLLDASSTWASAESPSFQGRPLTRSDTVPARRTVDRPIAAVRDLTAKDPCFGGPLRRYWPPRRWRAVIRRGRPCQVTSTASTFTSPRVLRTAGSARVRLPWCTLAPVTSTA